MPETTEAPQGIGANNPPEPIDFVNSRERINALLVEGRNWLDGSKIETQEQANEVARLLEMFRAEIKQADSSREREVAPINKTKAEIQARWNELIGDTKTQKGTAVQALAACKAVLLPWEVERENARRAEAELLRAEAETAEREARLAHALTSPADLDGRIAADGLVRDAKEVEGVAREAERKRTETKGVCRKVSIRRNYTPRITDKRAFARFLWETHPNRMDDLLRLAAVDLTRAGVRDMPGVALDEVTSVQ